MKELFKAAGFTERLTEETYEKWEKIGTHVGRHRVSCPEISVTVSKYILTRFTSTYISMQ